MMPLLMSPLATYFKYHNFCQSGDLLKEAKALHKTVQYAVVETENQN